MAFAQHCANQQTNMGTLATNRSATAVGAVAGLILFFAGPVIDGPDRAASVWLVMGVVSVGLPAYFYVLGIPAEDRTGLWVLRPALLIRIGCFMLAAGAVVAFAVACTAAVQFVRVDRCLDSGGRWNREASECER